MEEIKHKKIPRQYYDNDFVDRIWLRRFFSDILHAKKFHGNPTLKEKVIASIFLFPSKATELSFSVALAKLGSQTIHLNSLKAMSRGSLLSGTLSQLKTMDVDGVILKSEDTRHYNHLKDLDMIAINGGCEKYGNPTQSIQDIYTLWQEHRRTPDLTVLAIGDNKDSKHIISTMRLLDLAGIKASALYINNFENVKEFLATFEKEIEKNKLIYIMEDEGDKFAGIEETQGYSIENRDIFLRIINHIKDLGKDILHSGSKSLDAMLDDYLEKRNNSIQNEKLKNGVIVKMHILYSMLNNSRYKIL